MIREPGRLPNLIFDFFAFACRWFSQWSRALLVRFEGISCLSCNGEREMRVNEMLGTMILLCASGSRRTRTLRHERSWWYARAIFSSTFIEATLAEEVVFCVWF